MFGIGRGRRAERGRRLWGRTRSLRVARRHRSVRSRVVRSVAAGAAVLLAGSALVASTVASTAQVSSVELAARYKGLAPSAPISSDFWLGSFKPTGYVADWVTYPWFCIQFGKPITGTDYGEVRQSRSGTEAAKAAYLIWKYSSSTSSTRHASIAGAVHDLMDTYTGSAYSWSTGFGATLKSNLGITDDVATLKTEAATFAGPWRFKKKQVGVAFDTGSTTTGQVTAFSLVSAAGKAVSADVTLTITSGNATFAGGVDQVTISNADASSHKQFTVKAGYQAGDTVKVEATVDGSELPPTTLIQSGAADTQSLVTTIPQSTGISARGDDVTPTAESVPVHASSDAVDRTTIGGALSDVVSVYLDEGDAWPVDSTTFAPVPAHFTVTWYGSPVRLGEDSPLDGALALGASKVAAKSFVADHAGDYSVDAGFSPSDYRFAYYYPVVSFDAGSSASWDSSWTAALHEANEETVVQFAPRTATRVSDVSVARGDALTDKVSVSGAQAGTTVVVASTVYGPFLVNPVGTGPGVPADAPVAGEVSTSVAIGDDGSGEATSPAVTATASGFYVWVESIAAGSNSDAFTSEFGQSSESAVARFTPSTTTLVNAATVAAGSKIHDRVAVSGAEGNSTVVVESTAYGPFDYDPVGTGPGVPADAPVLGTVTTKVRVDESGAGSATTDDLVAPSAGYVVWVEHIAATDTSDAFTSEFGQSEESQVAPFTPVVTSAVSAKWIRAAGSYTDAIEISGLPADYGRSKLDSDPAPVVTVYGPLSSVPARTSAIPASAPVLTSFSIDKAANGSFTTDAITPTAQGYYTIVVDFPAGSRTNAARTDYGIPSETIEVVAPTVRTQTSDQQVNVGDSVFDTVVVDGLVPDGTYAEVSLYDVTTQNSTCDAGNQVDWSSGRITVGTAGQFQTSRWTSTGPGKYVFVETLYAGDGTVLHRGECNDQAETTEVVNPTVSTKTSDQRVTVGARIHDVVTVKGRVPAGAYAIVRAYDVTSQSAQCNAGNAFDWDSGKIAVGQAGEYHTPDFTTIRVGKVVFVETLYSATDAVIHRGECNDQAETTTVDSPELADTRAQVAAWGIGAGVLGVGLLLVVVVLVRRRRSAE